MPPHTRAGSKAAAAASAATASATAATATASAATASASASASTASASASASASTATAAAVRRPRFRFVSRTPIPASADGAAAPSRSPLLAEAAEEAPPSSTIGAASPSRTASLADAPEEAPPSSATEKGDVAVKIISPLKDNRSYRSFKLSNSLRCLLIRDPDTAQAAVSLGVRVGYFCDPHGLEGLTHLLQNSVLYGHEGYGDFSELVHKNNGSVLACTLPEESQFCFNANCSVLPVALERFAQFFVKPKITVENLMETVPDSFPPTNSCVLNQLQKKLTSRSHPFSMHNSDDWKYVSHKANQKGLDILEELGKFHALFYSATNVSLVLLGEASLDEMEGMVVKNFSALQKGLKDSFRLTSHPCSEEFRQIFVKLSPLNGGNSLIVQWLLKRSFLKRAEIDSCSYLCHIFGLDTEGSLFPLLKKLGWTISAQAAETDCHSGFSVFSLSIELSASGHNHCNEIVGLVFNYIKMLKREGHRKFLFEQLQDVRVTEFNNGIRSTPISHVSGIVSNMQFLPPSDWLIGSSVPTTYSTDAIKQVLNQLSENSVRIFLVSDKFEKAGSKESFSGVQYSCKRLPRSDIEKWKSCAPTVHMYLPRYTKNEVAKKKASASLHFQSLELDKARSQLSEEEASAPLHSEQYLELDKATSQLSEEQQCSSRVCIIYDKRMEEHIPPPPTPDHKEPHHENPDRIRSIFRRLEKDILLERCVVYKSVPAKLKHLIEVHEDSYVVRILRESLTKTDCKAGTDMYYSKGSHDAILLSAGGAVKAAEMVVLGKHPHAFAVVRPPGHHASSTKESGFCYFNNVAVAANFLMKEHSKKVLIIDWDIHFGDGTSDIFKYDNNVLFISLHRHPCVFPEDPEADGENIGLGKGEGFNCNVCWKDKLIEDCDLFAVFDHVVLPLTIEFAPDIILISGGFDAALGDTLGDCCITPSGYASALQKLLQLNKGVVIVLEGGYNHNVTAECCSSCIKVLCGDFSVVKDSSVYYPLDSTWDTILTLRKLLQVYWRCFSDDIPAEVLARRRSVPDIPAEVLAPRRSRRPVKDAVT